MKSYTITYEPHELAGDHGHDWRIVAKGRLVAEGWTRGSKRNAEAEVRAYVRSLDRKAA